MGTSASAVKTRTRARAPSSALRINDRLVLRVSADLLGRLLRGIEDPRHTRPQLGVARPDPAEVEPLRECLLEVHRADNPKGFARSPEGSSPGPRRHRGQPRAIRPVLEGGFAVDERDHLGLEPLGRLASAALKPSIAAAASSRTLFKYWTSAAAASIARRFSSSRRRASRSAAAESARA